MTSDASKTRAQLINELKFMRRQLAAVRDQRSGAGRRDNWLESIGRSLPDLSFVYDLDGRYLIEALQRKRQEAGQHAEVLPICSFCHQIRDERKNWQELAVYLHKRFRIKLSHGVCPVCLPKHYPDYAD